MAQQTKLVFAMPDVIPGGSFDSTTLLVDASGEKAACIVKIYQAGQLRKVGFRTGTVVQAQTIRVSFQDLDATTGNPDESQDQYRDTSIADTDDSVWKTTGLITSDGTDTGTLRTVAKGDYLAIVFEHNPFNSGDIFRLSAGFGGDFFNSLYCDLKTGGTWNKNLNLFSNLALIYDDGSGGDASYLVPDILPALTWNSAAFNSGSSPNKRGLKFQLPQPSKITGVRLGMTVAGDYVVKLYDSDGTSVLQTTASHDKDFVKTSAVSGQMLFFPTDQALLANTNYYVMIEPSSANSVTLNSFDVNSAALLGQVSGGTQFHYVDNSGASGAFVALTTRRPRIQLLLSAFDDAVGNPRSPFASPVIRAV